MHPLLCLPLIQNGIYIKLMSLWLPGIAFKSDDVTCNQTMTHEFESYKHICGLKLIV